MTAIGLAEGAVHFLLASKETLGRVARPSAKA